MANREIRDDNAVQDSTTVIGVGGSGTRIKAVSLLPPETPNARSSEPLRGVPSPAPTNPEFALASPATPATAPSAGSGMAGPYHPALEIASGGMPMEFLRGEPLSRVFEALTPDRVESPRHPMMIARVIANLAEGLHAAHTLKDTHEQRLDVVHRHITPQNSFVLCDGTVRVTDFGIARARTRSHQAEGGRVKEKLSYMSPEQLNQQAVDCRSDLWSLGVVTWELLTARRLFKASSEGETVLSVLSRPIPPPSLFAASVPRQLDAIVLRALSRDAAQRFSSARELVRALETFLAAASDTVPTTDVAAWVEELFPGAAKRSDGLIELAHAALPPELLKSQRPSSLPVSGQSSSQSSKGGAPTLRRTGPQSLAAVTDRLGSGLRWRRASPFTVALVAGLLGVLSFVRSWLPGARGKM